MTTARIHIELLIQDGRVVTSCVQEFTQNAIGEMQHAATSSLPRKWHLLTGSLMRCFTRMKRGTQCATPL